jgi:hypothetical protein
MLGASVELISMNFVLLGARNRAFSTSFGGRAWDPILETDRQGIVLAGSGWGLGMRAEQLRFLKTIKTEKKDWVLRT